MIITGYPVQSGVKITTIGLCQDASPANCGSTRLIAGNCRCRARAAAFAPAIDGS